MHFFSVKISISVVVIGSSLAWLSSRCITDLYAYKSVVVSTRRASSTPVVIVYCLCIAERVCGVVIWLWWASQCQRLFPSRFSCLDDSVPSYGLCLNIISLSGFQQRKLRRCHISILYRYA